MTGRFEGLDPAQKRLYGMMQTLMVYRAQGATPPPGAPRNVVSQQDALEAVLLIAEHVDALTQSGRIHVADGGTLASMLMLVRDYIEPLPHGADEYSEADGVKPDLEATIEVLRAAQEATS
ncbi:hypothetical protein [Yinghuangia seranimata]|uniref:hypothetical protein n=1 Tax=Yinghuangia seranimata TaxID=408067 RepID=UPI00248BAFC9|nr:hypothetical protein [Yinghuangia seranimata]MDI2126937.1 hypothetical protein [Yinghuangia seranimata]